MATQDVLNTALTQLQALTTPAQNAAQIATLQAQITSLQSQLATATAQLQALQTGDSAVAAKVLQVLRQMLPVRVDAISIDNSGPTPVVTIKPNPVQLGV